ncbi:MAG: glycine zipper 2TM domain-containing protein [Burkholderiaceae bacterium]|jgi:uncharacterized protein YcfJ|nr:glycine zipper 2TM domain-containing protein [Burkholderiaceae bacterium]
MTTSFSRIYLAALALLAGGLAQAQPVAQQMPPQPSSTVVARVVSATPQMQPVPVQACNPAAAAPTGGGAAIGALAGGAVGSQIGNGSGRIAGAILGAIGGAIAGNTIEAQNRAVTGAGCGVQYQNQVTGYDVQYEWSGHQYHTQMASDPGQWIRVTEPVGDGSYAEPAYASAGPQPGDPVPGYPPVPATPVPPQQPVAGNQLIAPQPQPAYNPPYPYPYPVPAAAYPPPPAYAPPAYAPSAYPPAVYPAPVMQPAPVYVGPPVGLSIGVGGRRSGVGLGIGF